jgi:lipopolysaccharide export system protein LptC
VRLIPVQAIGRGNSHLSAGFEIENHDARALLGSGRRDGARMFRRAMRHSRMVRALRIGVPAAIVLGGVAVFAMMTVLDPLRALAKLPVDISGLVVSGTKITMQAPRLVGYTRDKRPYSLTAKAAAQDVANPNVLELQDIRATMQTQDKGAFQLSARRGVYDTKSEKLTLHQSIVVKSSNYEGHLSEASVEVRKGHIVSEKPVEVRMLQGTINANRLEVENSGDIVRFGHGVTMVVTAEAAAPKADAKAATKTGEP